MQNHFELFNLPQRYAVDAEALNGAYRDVQNRVHPDKFVNATDAEKRVAMQWATRANEAYQTLKNPQLRARYLCELNGVDLQTESNTSMPGAFLMQQMEWREELEDARAGKDLELLETLDGQLRAARKDLLKDIEARCDAGDYHAAAQDVRAMMFLEKFGEEVRFAFDALEA
ncbi:Fe-S protein assembly co-chaperone HscB [Pseudoduganella namucuonensis]|uniref:Co-chaperone protein HscB homolog n=1 Tax=Pseudoduganella namucuonensis TaxID=1035707 RepID=A0A1I7JQ72_9BURK|nr:Fe-S protein assembly co-chaperone HscB [Pseudoduganella namucuonensis]SFU87333.1 Co-chaperone protein HscB [Pseudoduganella namucuonensis]